MVYFSESLRGSFLAVSKPIFVTITKAAFESVFRNVHFHFDTTLDFSHFQTFASFSQDTANSANNSRAEADFNKIRQPLTIFHRNTFI